MERQKAKLSLFVNDVILCIENTRDSPQKTVRNNKHSKVLQYRINTQNSVVFQYTNNKLSEKEIKKTIPFIIATKIIKYIGKNLTKKVEDIYTKNCKVFE